MTAFAQTFLMARAHNGGVEDLAAMRAAGFADVRCDVVRHEDAELGAHLNGHVGDRKAVVLAQLWTCMIVKLESAIAGSAFT